MDYKKQKLDQYEREKMAEVRSYRKPPESRANKIKRFSEDSVAVAAAHEKVQRVNIAAKKLLRAIEDLTDDKDVWPLGFDEAEDFFKSKVNLPSASAAKLLGLARLRKKLGDRWRIDDYKALELLSQLGHEDLRNTTLRIIQDRSLEPTLDRIICTIKEIHVDGLTQLRIPKATLDKFIKNKYVKPTRPDLNMPSLCNDIHHQFEELVASGTKKRTGPRGFDHIQPDANDVFEIRSTSSKRRKRKRRIK